VQLYQDACQNSQIDENLACFEDRELLVAGVCLAVKYLVMNGWQVCTG
jgi:hypothetical protein